MITARDSRLADHVAKRRVHGGREMYHHEFVGTNSRLDTLQAAVPLAKLDHLDGWLAGRRANAARYFDLLARVDGVRAPVVLRGNDHSYNQFTIRAARRDELRAWLSKRGIGTGLYYPVPLHLQPCFAPLGYREGQLPTSERLCTAVVSLPDLPRAHIGRDRRGRLGDRRLLPEGVRRQPRER